MCMERFLYSRHFLYIHFIWLFWVLVMARGIFSFRMWALIPQPGMEPGPPALGVQSFSLWATREVPCTRHFFRSFICIISFYPQITPPISIIWRTGKLKQGEIELSAQDQVAFKGQSRGRDPDGWLHCLKWSEVAQSCPTLCDSMDCSLPGSSIRGIFQARVLEWVTIWALSKQSWFWG